MLSTEEYNDKIDAFVKGSLSADESASLQASLDSNPALKSEFLFQQSLIAGIQAKRKAELKARLNKIVVPAAQPTYWRYAVLAGVALAVSVALNYLPNDLLKNDKAEVKIATTDKLENLGEVDLTQEELVAIIPQDLNQPESKTNQVTATVKSSVANKNANQQNVDKDNGKEVLPNLPEVHSPDFSGNEHVGKEVETPDHSLVKSKEIRSIVSGVEVVKSKKHKFHYRYFDSKLFLYGDFEAKTYDILELNNSKGQQLYLKFENNYYELKPDKTEISKLELVKAKETLKELEEIQKK